MTSYQKLKNSINNKKSMLCVGLDSDIKKLPFFYEGKVENLLDFNKKIIDATSSFTAAYKINFAFYEQYGLKGIEILEKTFEFIPDDIFTIADAKRGDIGNTSGAYAKSVFEYYNADSVTVNPYMGFDSVSPFLEFEDKITYILGLTSNHGSKDIQKIKTNNNQFVFENVINKSSTWSSHRNLGYVVGATQSDEFSRILKIIPEYPLLIPGIGAQGGNLDAVLNTLTNNLSLINVSRGIIYASSDENFTQIVRKTAEYYKLIMEKYIT